MIETVWNFYRRGMRGYGRRIFATTHPYLSGMISYGFCESQFSSEKSIKLAGYISTFVTYNTVIFGFTATAIALSIAIPSPSFIRFLSSLKSGTTPFRDFLFVLAWNGIVYIIAFFMMFPLIILGDEWKLNSSTDPYIKIYLFFLLWMQLYACFQFLVTTISIFELGDLYARFMAKTISNAESEQ